MRLFGPLHISLLIAIACIAATLPLICRRASLPFRGARLTIGWALAVNEIVWWMYRYSHEGIHAANLPLQLCDLSVWLSILGCLTLIPTVVEFAYFAGLAGAGMALLTPNLWSPWPTYPAMYFFLAHGGIVIAVAFLAFSGGFRFRPGAVWRSFGLLLCYAAMVGAVNAKAGSNFMYMSHKPNTPSLLDQLGPWPWYLVGGAAIGLAFFWLLWLPVRPTQRQGQSTL
jgi:hypothetical integral membrane protein (TIGR02206 family)